MQNIVEGMQLIILKIQISIEYKEMLKCGFKRKTTTNIYLPIPLNWDSEQSLVIPPSRIFLNIN